MLRHFADNEAGDSWGCFRFGMLRENGNKAYFENNDEKQNPDTVPGLRRSF